ncbi:MAG TPA: Kae1-associated kinase Bud32 [Candidatus Nanoarchaeia archaeon]|nr:Kae1-associated kinase Bud32 [Candidatus Nanoarchaeia archaeon]
MSELIGHGAEAKLFKVDNKVIKERPAKDYRLAVIDNKLRKQRTKREAKVLETLKKAGIPAPELFNVEDNKLEMSFIDGPKVRDVLTPELAKEIGRKVGLLHQNGIIHADLTTSNMILKDQIHLIDFGLSFFSQKVEDMAVDLHVLDSTLKSSHHELYDQCITKVFDGYKETFKDANKVLERLNVVEKRGRNKKK